jgi:DNA-binding NtrC family response regulator
MLCALRDHCGEELGAKAGLTRRTPRGRRKEPLSSEVLAMEFPRVVLAFPDARGGEAFSGVLRSVGLKPEVVGTTREVRRALEQGDVSLLVCACELPDGSVRDLLEEHVRVPVVVALTRPECAEYLDNMRRGAFDCIAPPYRREEVHWILSNALPEQCGHLAPRTAPVSIRPAPLTRRAAG